MGILGLNVALLKMALQPMKHGQENSLRGIVVAESATVRLSPFETAEDRGQLASGREVVLGEFRNGYYWIDGAAGLTQGWVRGDEVQQVIPSRDHEES